VRNLIRRFVEVGVTGYHIEDQRPGTKKCGHQGGKVLVSQDEQIKRLNAARFQLDVMRVPGIIVARTDAEAATLLDNNGDERDHPFILGATNVSLPSYKIAVLAAFKHAYDQGMKDLNGHQLYEVSDEVYAAATAWMDKAGVTAAIKEALQAAKDGSAGLEQTATAVRMALHEAWENEAGLKTYREAVAEVMQFHIEDGSTFEMSVEEWDAFAKGVSLKEARAKARAMGINIIWDCEISRTPEGYYQVRGGIEYAIAKSLGSAPFADILWMETKTADLADAKEFAEAIHAKYPDKMLAYNLSPSFSWDTTGMTEEEMSAFPAEIGKLGFVFNFITYGGHQVDGLATEEFATALKQEGMLALARLQRKFRLLESPYKTPQTLVGGPRLDGALMASSGRTATTMAMGKGSTQFQHLVQTEVPMSVLSGWLDTWRSHYGIDEKLKVELKPHSAGSELLELVVLDKAGEKVANVIFATIQDRQGHKIMSVRDQNNFNADFRQKRFMTLLKLYLIHRYDIDSIHYVTPNEANEKQAKRMEALGLYEAVHTEVGHIIVANVNTANVATLLKPDSDELTALITKG
jgi:isocitrate lyase